MVSSRWVARVVTVSALGLIALQLLSLSRDRIFFFDEWDFVVNRNQLSIESIFSSHNGHPSAVPAAVYLLFLNLFGIGFFSPFIIAGLTVHLLVTVLVGRIVAQHVNQWVALPAMIAMGLLGTGWQNSMWPFQIGFMGSVASFLATVLLLGDGTTAPSARKLTQSSIALVIGVMCSSVGLAGIGAVALVTIGDRSRRQREWWTALPAAAIYLLWYVGFGSGSATSVSLSPSGVADYVLQSASSAAASLGATSQIWGALAIGLLIPLLALRIRRAGKEMRSSLLLPTSFLAVFWAMTAVSRGDLGEPGASRYTYIGAVGLIVIVAQISQNNKVAASLMFIGLSASAVLTSSALLSGSQGLRYESEVVRAQLEWVEEHAALIPPDLVVDPIHAPQLMVGSYLESKARLGGSISSPSGFSALSPGAAQALDSLVARSWVLRSEASAEVGCGNAIPVDRIDLDPGSTISLISGDEAFFTISRFSDTESMPIPLEAVHTQISVPHDKWTQPWSLRLSGTETFLCTGLQS